ncbi:PCLO-like protein, partial [Mya arenaria]
MKGRSWLGGEMEWVCHVCHKRRQLVLSSGLWHPGCDVDEDIPLSREMERRLHELEHASAVRGPLTRSTSMDGPGSSGPSLQRQMSLPDYQMPQAFSSLRTLEVIPESNMSDIASPEPPSAKAVSPPVTTPTESEEMKKSTVSANGGGSIRGMGQANSRSESEYSDGVSDVDMEDASLFRSAEGVSPDDVSDDYSFMSLGSSDDNQSLPVRRKHRPKSLNLSRSVSGTSSEDETSDSAISTDVESKYAASVHPPDPHELRIALAASAFVEDMRGVDANTETDDEVADISAKSDNSGSDKVRFSPSAPVSPSWREGLDSPPFSPRRRDSYPGKRRGSSPVSPKDKRFTYTDISPPSRQLSIEDLYDKESQPSNGDPSLVPHAQRPSPKSPDEMKDSFYSNSGELLTFERPTSSLKKSKPFYSLEDAAMDLNDSTTIMDLATYAATVASNTANLTSMSISPTNLETKSGDASPESRSSSSPVSPGYYDNVNYPGENSQSEESEGEVELADPSQKSIDYQNSKRQKARPPTTDWSPVIDLSPILDVSPSLEEAEQAEMLAQQQEERERQASREGDEYAPMNTFVAIGDGQDEPDYLYYGLKRYEVVEDISELVNQQNNANGSNAISSVQINNVDHAPACDSAKNVENVTDTGPICTSTASAMIPNKAIDVSSSNAVYTSTDNVIPKQVVRSIDTNPNNVNMVLNKEPLTDNSKPTDTSGAAETKSKARRKLPEPTAEIIATQKPIPKPRRKEKAPDLPSGNPPPKPARALDRADLKEPTRNPPIYSQSALAQKAATGHKPKPQLQKQGSEERRRTAKEMKAKPDPLIMCHLELEEASASPQYRVLESPPSPENKAAIRREYSDSTSVSPSSSPDRESFQYPSPVTPPDSDSSPPKPHSPSSGTDFEDEFILICDESSNSTRAQHVDKTNGRNKDMPDNGPKVSARGKEKGRNGSRYIDERGSKHTSIAHEMATAERGTTADKAAYSHTAKSKPPSTPGRDHKGKDMKKVRRKLPPLPPEEDPQPQPTGKPKQRPVPARKPPPRADNRMGKGRSSASSGTSDDSSMNEDDWEVAAITRKQKQVNNLDKPSIDKQNGNYIKSKSGGGKTTNQTITEVNIPPDIDITPAKLKDDANKGAYINETDAIIDAMISIYGEPITNAMKGLKRRLQDELRRVTEGRRRKIDEFEELRVLKIQLGELKIGASNKSNSTSSSSNGKKRNSSNSRTSPQMINRRARHKRQSSDPMVSKFSPIKEDKDIESEIQIAHKDDSSKGSRTDDSSLSGVSDSDSTRSEPVKGTSNLVKKMKPSDYAKMFYNQNAQTHSQEILDKCKDTNNSPQLITSHSDGNLPNNAEDEETRIREEKRRELQFEIEKRKKQIAEREAKLKEARYNVGVTTKQLTQSCDEISTRMNIPPYHPRPIPTGIIKPIDDDGDSFPDNSTFQNQANYSSTEYLAHKQEEFLRQRLEGFSSFSSPFLYSADFGEKSAFVPQPLRTNLDSYSYSTGNVNVGKDKVICASATLPNIPMSKADLENNNRPVSDTESSPPCESTPAMPLLSDVKARSRKIIHDIGAGSRPVSAEFNVGMEDLMNGMCRVESDNSVDADEPIMKHLMEGGVTILKQLERKKQPPPSVPKKYDFPVKRILLTTDPKEKHGKGRPGNGIGMKVVGGKAIPGSGEVGAFVATIYKGGVADQTHGEVNEGDQILEWNGMELTGKSYEEVQQILAQASNGEVELRKTSTGACVDARQIAATLEGIEEDESPCLSQSSSQHDYTTPSASSGCSSPLSEPASTSSEQNVRVRRPTRRSVATATATVGSQPASNQQSSAQHVSSHSSKTVNNKTRYGSQGQLLALDSAPIKLSPSVSDIVRRPSQTSQCSDVMSRAHHSGSPTKQPKNRQQYYQLPPQPTPTALERRPSKNRAETSKSPPRIEKQNSEKLETRKKEQLSQQSNSFDDFIRMSHHAGVDERQTSPSKSRPKSGLSVSASELVRRKGSESEDDIKRSPKASSRGNRQMGDIQLQIWHDEHQHELKVKVAQARNLLPMDLNGLSDPFAKLYLLPGRCAENKRRTKHIARTLNPEWHETSTFPNVHREELRNKTLEVTVWDYDRFKANDFLGEVVIDFSEEAFLDKLPHWYPLCGHDDSKGLDIPQPTVLPPRGSRSCSASPRQTPIDKPEKSGSRGDRVRPGLGRRRRSFDTLQDVDISRNVVITINGSPACSRTTGFAKQSTICKRTEDVDTLSRSPLEKTVCNIAYVIIINYITSSMSYLMRKFPHCQ